MRASALAPSISFARFSTCRSVSPRATKSRSRRMICPARKACSAARSIASRTGGIGRFWSASSSRMQPFK
jgi:hypothetical protein